MAIQAPTLKTKRESRSFSRLNPPELAAASAMIDGSLHTRQTSALELCYYVQWSQYNWHDIVQCNFFGTGTILHWNPAVYCLLAASHAVSAFIALQIIVRALTTFKSWRTLYFWSLIIAASGLILEVMALQLFFFPLGANSKILGIFTAPAGIMLKTGFALVLYSRLHLVILGSRHTLLRVILGTVIVSGIINHVPTTISIIVSSYGPEGMGYKIYEIVMYFDFFTSLESIALAGLYIYYCRHYLLEFPPHASDNFKQYAKRTFRLLIVAYIFVLAYETSTLTLLCKKLILVRDVVEPPMYGAKLSIEIFVLDRLMRVSKLKTEALQRGNMSAPPVEDKSMGIEKSGKTDVSCDFVNDAADASTGPNVQSNELPLGEIEDYRSESHALDELERQYLGLHSMQRRL